MTKQEAVEVLKDKAFVFCEIEACDWECDKCHEALNMAIKSLEQEPSCRNSRQVDLISRADLQELFNETTTSLMDKIEQKDIEHLVRACVMVTEMIQDAPSVVPKRGEWIPASERLPEDNRDVLMCLEWGIDIGTYDRGEWHSEWINHYDDDDVIAWMKLPEPYREGAEQ